MSHLSILPILIPMFAGALLLMLPSLERLKRGISVIATLALVPLALVLMARADDGQLQVYALGGWQPPFGIVLLLDRLAALMLLATAVLGSAVVLYAVRGDDRRGLRFHALLQLQLLGINGAFMTGDLFNLFVFFEIMLIASYAALFYLLHSTWVAGGMFLLADLIARQRGDKAGLLVQGPALMNPHLLGGAFFFGAIAVAGLPPLSGFIGKVLLLKAVAPGVQAALLWSLLLGGSLLCLVALSRAGSTLFWRVGNDVLGSAELDRGRLLATFALLATALLLVAFAAPLLDYVQATAVQLHDVDLYRQVSLPGATP